jgi:polyhydroxyalkanoate synthesis regulator phasin
MIKEEMTKVLEMVQEGKITAAQGQQLLEAMGAYEEGHSTSVSSAKKMKLYIKVLSHDGDKVNVALPLYMVKAGIRLGTSMGKKYAPEELGDIDMDEVVKMVEEMVAQGESGDIVQVDSADGDTVHIYLQ